VIAQTKTGSTSDVVMAGAHLDSVPEGPGINDNGSGVAAILETAVQLGNSPHVQNAVRFGFWGAEELGLIGSRNYVESLNLDALKDIALYLNFDMLASPNPGYFTYDGDQSLPLDARGQPVVPEGSAGIERTFVAYLKAAGKTARDTSFDGRSDYDGFTLAGIPSGGLFSGAEGKMSDEQAKLWGGRADEPFDPNYHTKTDTLDHIDRTSLGIQGAGVAYAIGLYAQDLTGRNGVPVMADRTRNVLAKP
jgi:Zn-dependent M28 family amino/carboxypeptidase